ncbi:MAG: ferrochelatase [Alphaproteobacteria bacterium]|nr:ferrochelatase [Alphaproteobacteria bacterium]
MARTAVVLFNLGGPDGPDAVRPFLFNLFNDPAIIGAPGPIRWALARFISARRAPVARAIYDRIGGRSPLLELTRAQAAALEEALGGDHRVFVAMRYWHPLTEETVAEVAAWRPDRVALLPLYPQYSSTTSGSSIEAWRKAAAKAGLTAPTEAICCWPTEPGFIGAVARLTAEALAASPPGARVLFSAHGLPKKVIAAGDPYQWQVERTAEAVVAALGVPGLDWLVCYQSRVGPLEWIGPATDDEIRRAGADKVGLVVVPIAFVSEHSETLVELDIEYAELAHQAGVPSWRRVPAVATAPDFVAGLAGLVRAGPHGRICPAACGRCPTAGEP